MIMPPIDMPKGRGTDISGKGMVYAGLAEPFCAASRGGCLVVIVIIYEEEA